MMMQRSQFYDQMMTALLPYARAWDEWVASDYCVLSEKEIRMIECYRYAGSINAVAKKLRCSNATVRDRLTLIYIKLTHSIALYKEWEKTRKEDHDYPLNVPVRCLKIGARLKHLLSSAGSTLNEILKEYSIPELLKMKGMGHAYLSELQAFLDVHGKGNAMRQLHANENNDSARYRFRQV